MNKSGMEGKHFGRTVPGGHEGRGASIQEAGPLDAAAVFAL